MAQINRYDGNVQAFGINAQGTERTVFGDTAQADDLDSNITADFLRGWGIVSVNENPTKQDFNGLAFTLSQLIAYLHQRGIPEWNTNQEYFAGSIVTTDEGVYRLKSGGDGSVDPDTDDGTNYYTIFRESQSFLTVATISDVRPPNDRSGVQYIYVASTGTVYELDSGDGSTANSNGSVLVDAAGNRFKAPGQRFGIESIDDVSFRDGDIAVTIDDTTLTGAKTLVSGATLEYGGGTVTVNSGVTFTVNGQVAWTENQIFNNNGTITGTFDNVVINPRMFGAVGDDSNDDSSAVTDCDSVGVPWVLTPGRYRCSQLSLVSDFWCMDGAEFVFNGSVDQDLIEITGNQQRVGRYAADGDDSDTLSLLRASGNDQVIGEMYLRNVVASASASAVHYGFANEGNRTRTGAIYIDDFENTGYSNKSSPQALGIVSTSDEIQLGPVKIQKGASGLTVGSSADRVTCESLMMREMSDNGIYQLGGTSSGSNLNVGYMFYHSNDGGNAEEAVVTQGTVLNIGTLDVEKATACLRLQNAEDVNIGAIHCREKNAGDIASILSTRSSNTQTGSVRIGSIQGRFTALNLMRCVNGTVDYLAIRNVDIEYLHDTNFSQGASNFCDLSNIDGFHFENWSIRIIDVNDILSGEQFSLTVPTVSRNSVYKDIAVYLLQSDETSFATAGFRGSGLAQDNVKIKSVPMRVTVGPYAKEYHYGEPDTANGTPAAGTWRKGQWFFYRDNNISAGGKIGTVCVTAGTPGTWKDWGAIDA